MASSKWVPRIGTGTWSASNNWTPTPPALGSDVTIGASNDTGNVTVTDDVAASINSLTLAGSSAVGYTTTLTLTTGHSLTVAGPISLPVRTTINGTGTLVANGAITGRGAIVASNGLLTLSGAGSIASGGPTFSIGTAAASTLNLDLAAVTTGAITINNANQTLQIGSAAKVTLTAAETISLGQLQMSGGTLTDTHGITLGALLTGGTITGFGTLAAAVSTAASSTGDIVRAVGGTLDLQGNISASLAGLTLAIDASAPADLKIDGKASINNTVAITSANQTLEIGATGALTIGVAETITAGTIKLDGGKLTDTSGLAIGAGATLKGLGTVTAPISGTGTVLASGGVLDLVRALSAGPAYLIDSAAGSVLKVDGAAAAGTKFTFAGPTGTLELSNVTSGIVRNFNGTVSGLAVGTSATVPTNDVNIQATLTKATLSGSQIVVANGTTTVATLQLAAAPAAGTVAVVAPDAKLGGYDVFLSAGLPSVTWSAPAGPGVEGSAIALGTLTPSGGNPLTSVLISGIPLGATLSDGSHTFTAITGTTSVNVLGWNYASLTITPANDANVSLSVQATDNQGNTTSPVTEAVTVNPLAPTVTPVAVTGTAGQPIPLNLGIAAAGPTGDANTLSSVTIGAIPAGATFSNTNHDTLTPVNGSLTLSAAQLSAGVLNGLSITTVGAATFNLSVSATEQDAEGNASTSASGSEAVTANGAKTNGVPAYSHIVVVVEENKDANQIIGDTADAPYLNSLASGGANLTNYYAITHPSQPNYFALYAGSTFGTTDDLQHSEPDPTIATILQAAGKSFVGYVESPNDDFNHNPWESFPEGTSVESDFSNFPTTNFANLPTVSFVSPNVDDDMHNGTVQQGDAWLQANLSAYAQWAQANNSLLVVTWDEGDGSPINQIPTIMYGADVVPGNYDTAYNHYNMLSTILTASGLTAPNNAAGATPIQVFGPVSTGSGRTISTSVTGPVVLAPADNPLTITSTGSVTTTTAGDYGVNAPIGTDWTITNAGSVSSASGVGVFVGGNGSISNTGKVSGTEGIQIRAGGSVNNAAGGSISGSGSIGGGLAVGAGVYLRGPALSVTNQGTISGGAYGVAMRVGGQPSNSATISNSGTIAGGEDGVILQGGAATITNSGDISGSVDDGIALNAGGTVSNSQGATISGSKGAAIFVQGGTATITNDGTISQGLHAILIQSGGSVTNDATGLITASNTGVFFKTLPGAVTNYGQINATGPEGTGVYLEDNGSIINANSGSISGAKFGAFIEGGAGTLANYGAISGGSYDGVVLGLGGTVTNAAGATIFGKSGGLYAKYRAPATVTNAGTIGTTGTTGAGVDLADGGSFTNQSTGSVSGADHGVFIISGIGTVINNGAITGSRYHGVHLGAGGTASNVAGATITGGTAGIYGGKTPGVQISNAGAVSATASTGSGVDLEDGGTVTNAKGASFSGGSFGVFITGTAGTVTNDGTMSGGHGVGLEAGGSLTNDANASIQGQTSGVFAQGGPTSVTNAGSITASAAGGAAADIEGGGIVTNKAGATLSGTAYGVFLTGSGTVDNAGTISGASYAVKFGGTGTNNRLVVESGAVFNGAVGGASGGTNVLEFAGGTGTLSGVSSGSGGVTQGANSWSFFGGFGTVQVDSGATWTFTGTDSVAAVINQGTIGVTGPLDITSGLDPTSTGVFQLATGASLEVAAATGSGGQIAFLGASALAVDDFAAFGTGVGTSSYSGLQLADFTSGDSVDLKNFSATGLSTPVFNSSTGVLQITNGASQAASLLFQTSTLGTGTLQVASDGAAGTRVFLA